MTESHINVRYDPPVEKKVRVVSDGYPLSTHVYDVETGAEIPNITHLTFEVKAGREEIGHVVIDSLAPRVDVVASATHTLGTSLYTKEESLEELIERIIFTLTGEDLPSPYHQPFLEWVVKTLKENGHKGREEQRMDLDRLTVEWGILQRDLEEQKAQRESITS